MRTEKGLYDALETALKKAKEPQTCGNLFERPEISMHAATANRVSDYLGHMWRKGLLTRQPSPRMDRSGARWMYQWLGRPEAKSLDPLQAIVFTGKGAAARPKITVDEATNVVTIELPEFTIVVKPK